MATVLNQPANGDWGQQGICSGHQWKHIAQDFYSFAISRNRLKFTPQAGICQGIQTINVYGKETETSITAIKGSPFAGQRHRGQAVEELCWVPAPRAASHWQRMASVTGTNHWPTHSKCSSKFTGVSIEGKLPKFHDNWRTSTCSEFYRNNRLKFEWIRWKVKENYLEGKVWDIKLVTHSGKELNEKMPLILFIFFENNAML